MSKLWLIIKREYSVRVKKKMFIVTTLLTPIGIGLLTLVGGYLAAEGSKSFNKVMVKDDTGILEDRMNDSSSLEFEFSDQRLDSLLLDYSASSDMLVHFESSDIEELKPVYYTKEKLGISIIERVESQLGHAVKEYKIEQSGIDRELYESFDSNITLENGAIDDTSGTSETSSKLSILIATVIGGLMSFLMYFVIFIYGGMVMRSVMEEKINRIVEVMISSVKPFQLMMGKILGVGAVGLTQLAIWIILIPIIMLGVQLVLGLPTDPGQLAELQEQMNALPKGSIGDWQMSSIIQEIQSQNWAMILPVFVIFFFGGYFIYSSLFAAVGSAVGDDMGESQQLMVPLAIPIFIAFIMAQGVVQNPSGGMAIFGSMFPLFSPIIMPVRLAFDPPLWEILLSIVILILSCIFFAWLSGRIYRVGILMYGKKVTFRELGKWLFYKS